MQLLLADKLHWEVQGHNCSQKNEARAKISLNVTSYFFYTMEPE
jgi:hypothetical protein